MSWHRHRPRTGHRRCRLRHGDVGSATVLVVAMAAVLMFVTVALAALSGLVAAQRRAQSAADLTALAAAAGGKAHACAEALRTATANGAALESCAVDGAEVRVAVSVAGPQMAGRDVRVSAEARAGPG